MGKCLFLAVCIAGSIYQGRSLYREYTETMASELELVEKPFTYPPAVTVCVPYIRLFNRSFIYDHLWRWAFSSDGIHGDSPNCLKYSELVFDENGLNESLNQDKEFEVCINKFAGMQDRYLVDVTVENFLDDWISSFTNLNSLNITI